MDIFKRIFIRTTRIETIFRSPGKKEEKLMRNVSYSVFILSDSFQVTHIHVSKVRNE